MQFEWDRAKAENNLRKHGVSFDDALHVFADPFRLDAPDFRTDYGEARRLTMGEIDGRLHVVAYAMRGDVVRLISARKANEREQRRYGAAKG
jgi:uncharacterized DUF497 family protein